MKKIWSLMLVALVMLGAAACTETDESVDKKQESAGVSFYAEIASEDTRAFIDNSDGDKTWKTIWESGDTLDVFVDGGESYKFVCTDAAAGKFTCADSGAAELVGQEVTISSNLKVHAMDSRLGKKALFVWTRVGEFKLDAKIQLTTQTSFFRYTYDGEGAVTLKLELMTNQGETIESFSDGSGNSTQEITFTGIKGENFVPFWCGVSEDSAMTATLSYAIDGVKVKETTIENIGWGKVYNLGTLTDPEKIYLVPNDGWKADNAWFSAHFFNSVDGYADVKMTDEDGDGIYACAVPYGMEKVLFCRMNPAYTEFGWNDDTMTDDNKRLWTQTGDETIGVAPNNYYYIVDWTIGVWGTKDGYEMPAVNLGVIGFGGNWDTDIDMTLEGQYYTLKNKEIRATDTFKIRVNDGWDVNYGASGEVEPFVIEVGESYTLVEGGKNLQITTSAIYDLYFNYVTKEFKAQKVGDIEVEGETPGQTTPWALCGDINGWGDTAMLTTIVKNVFVAKNVEILAYQKFKVRKDKSWTENYGGGIKYMNPNGYIQVYSDGSDIMMTEDGTYDVYFDLGVKVLYVVAAGTDYTTVKMQTTEGSAPDHAGHSWGLCSAHNNWGNDDPLTWDSTISMYVAKNVTLNGEFKVRADKDWAINYGSGSDITVNGSGSRIYSNGANSKVATGTYDVYVDLTADNEMIWIKTPGSSAPTK